MISVPKRMQDYAAFLSQDQHRPQQKFIATILPSLFVAKSLMLTHIARTGRGFPDDASVISENEANNSRVIDTRTKYLSRNLASDRLDMSAVFDRFQELIAPTLQRDSGRGITVVVDETDYRKEYARPERPRGMQGATHVRDGSRSTKNEADVPMGYPGITVEAVLPNGNSLPLAHWLFSRDMADPLAGHSHPSDMRAHAHVLGRVAATVGPRAWWAFDRGYAAKTYFALLDSLQLRWLTRLQVESAGGARHVQVAVGATLKIIELVETVPLHYDRKVRHGSGFVTLRMGLQKVFLPGEDIARTLLVGQFPNAKRFAFLASEWMGDKQEVAHLLQGLYRKRWLVEEVHRHMKDSRGWGFDVEDFRVLSLVAIQRLVLVAMLAAGFTALTRDHADGPLLASQAPVLKRNAKHPRMDCRYGLTVVIATKLEDWLVGWWKTRSRPRPVRRAGPSLEELLARAKRSEQNALRALARRKRNVAELSRRLAEGS